jgi:serine/threonine-protein kinase RsbT
MVPSAAPEMLPAGTADIAIASDEDVVHARREGRLMAETIGFESTESVLVATAISELARNIVTYARRGRIVLSAVENGVTTGICIAAIDDGPGIANIELAMQSGYSSSGGLGLGLPGVRRIMHEFHIASSAASGTHVRVVRWKQR